MIGHQVPQLRDQVCVVAQRQVQFGTFFDDADAELGQPVTLGIEKGLLRPSQTGSAPEAERVMQCSGGFPQVIVRPRGPAPAQLPVEFLKVEGARRARSADSRRSVQASELGVGCPADPGPSTRRRWEMWRCTRLTARVGGVSPHTALISRSREIG